MQSTLYTFSDVESKRANPKTLHDAIAEVLRADKDACYIQMERYLMPPGVTGSRYFDQAKAVFILLEYDKKVGKRISSMMSNTATLNEHALWTNLCSVLKKTGFRFHHGRVVGLMIEDKRHDSISGKDNDELANIA